MPDIAPTSPAASRTVGILELPIEVLEGIFHCFDDPGDSYPARTYWKQCYRRCTLEGRRQAIQNARLVCHLFNVLASQVLFATLELDISKNSLDYIDQLCSRPLLAKGIRHISLFLYYRPALDISRFADRRGEELEKIHYECLGNPPLNYDDLDNAWTAYIATANGDNVMPPQSSVYQQCLLQGYESYMQIQEEQFQLITQGTFVTRLAESLKRVPLSCSLALTDSTEAYPQYWGYGRDLVFSSTENLCRYLTTPFTWREIESLDGSSPLVPARILSDLPLAVERAGVLLTQLTVACSPTTQDFHLLCHNNLDKFSRGDLTAAFENLEFFDYQPCRHLIDAAPRSELIPTEERAFINQYISSALSSKRLWEIQFNLCGLGVVEEVEEDKFVREYYPLGPVLMMAEWPRLRRLKMRYVSLNQLELEGLCLQLGSCVEEFDVEAVKLVEGLWHDALDILREKLGSRCIRGECKISFNILKGGEFERDDVKSIDSMSHRELHDIGWDFDEKRTIVAQLAARYVNDARTIANPLHAGADIQRILSRGPVR